MPVDSILKKRVIVLYHGIIPELNNIYGPLTTPFMCDTDIIFIMIHTGKIVYEVFDDGTRLLLNEYNYNTDNGNGGGGTGNNPPTPYPPKYNLQDHLREEIESVDGIHKEVRYYNGKFEYFDDASNLWVQIYTDDKYAPTPPNTGISQIDVGGIPAGINLTGKTMDEIVYLLTHPTLKPTIEFTTDPDVTLNEIGTEVGIITLRAVVTKGARAITSVKFLKNGVVVNTPTVINTTVATYTYTFNAGITTNSTLSVVVNDGESDTIETLNVEFVYAKFIGSIPEGTPISNDIIALLDKTIDKENDMSKEYTVTDGILCIAVPSTRQLEMVYDQNGLIVTQLFTVDAVQYVMPDSSVVLYRVYYAPDVVNVTDFTVTYKLIP